MSLYSEYMELRKKRLKEETEEIKANNKKTASSKSTGSSSSKTKTTTNTSSKSSSLLDDYLGYREKRVFENTDVGPVSERVKSRVTANIAPTKKEDERKWFQKGLFDDGYDFGDITKTILGTGADVVEDIGTGIIGMGEKVVDAFATIAPYLANSQVGGFHYSQELQKTHDKAIEESKTELAKFVKKDLYDESKIAKKIVSGMTAGYDYEGSSVLGAKTDSVIQSGGQLLGTMGLQAVGVPWFLTTGATAFGSEAENALNEGATHEEAILSSSIAAGAEILTEKLSGGIKFGGKALDDVLTSQIARGISNKFVRNLAKAGLDAVGEGAEEWITEDINKFGQWLTYRSEEELEELLFSEEAMDEKIEAFIGGALLGGVSNVGNAINSKRKGIDSVTGRTNSEEAVVNKVYEDLIAEAQKDGKVTAKEKSKIYDRVTRELEKGGISTDVIEELLDEEGYKAYQAEKDNFFKSDIKKSYDDALRSEESQLKQLQEELDKLADAPNTVGNNRRYDSIVSQMTELQENPGSNAIKAQLDQEVVRINEMKNQLRTKVHDMVKGTKLEESYNELIRSNEKYTVDVSEYKNEHAKKTIQNILDSGMGDNTTKFHEYADWLAKISADKGMAFSLTNNEALKGTEHDFSAEGLTTNGFVTEDGITLNMDSPKALNSTVGHEITHVPEQTELYQTLQESVFNYARAKEGQENFDKRLKAIEARYQGKNADAKAELTADLVGDYLFTDYDFVHNLSTENRNVFQKIYDEIKYLCKVVTAGSKEARELEKVRKVFEDAYRTNVKGKPETNYSLSDTDGREVSQTVAQRFGNSKAVDENGNLKVLYHGTAAGEFSIFDKAKGSVEGDFGSGFYFTDNEVDVSEHYEGGGPDFDNKVARLAEQIEQEEDIDYEEAEERARAELYKGSHKFEVYLNIENPAVVGETMLFDNESYLEQYNEEDYEDYDDYIADVEQLLADDIENIVWEVEKNVDVYSTDGLADVLYNAYYEGGIGIEELKTKINELYLEDNNGNLVGNEVARQIIESLGYDGIIDPTVSGKWNMDMEEGTTHYIVFKPNQIKAVTNQNPTDNPDIHRSLSKTVEKPKQYGDWNVYGSDFGSKGDDFAPAIPTPNATVEEDIAPYEDNWKDAFESIAEKDAPPAKQQQKPVEETPKQGTRKALHEGIIGNVKTLFKNNGLDFDRVLKNAKDLSTFATVDNTPQRVMEKALGYKEGQLLSEVTVNRVARNETEGIKWLNSYLDRKSGILAKISKQYNIKPGSKASAAAQMYAEGFYVDENNEIIQYGDRELAMDFPDIKVQRNIKGLAGDPRIRQIYDKTLGAINASRTRNAYPEIPRLDNYFLHFRAMDDTFSRLGLPFNPNDIRAKDLPTDLNGVTADLKPGQPYFASAMHRKGKRTSFDLLGGLERYLTSAKNQIYHIDDIQTLRALRNYIADTYGQANGLEGLDALSDAEAEERIKQVYGSHLSTFAKFLNEEANVLAGKTALIDRGLEGIIGRRGITFLNTINQQVGANMVGWNISSSLTNFLPVAQTFAKTNKFDFVKAFAQTTANKIGSMVGKTDGFAENSPVVIRRKGADRFYRTTWQKLADPGYVFMSAVDDISTELIARTKYNELTRKGMGAQRAHYETDKWVSRLMGDRSLGQMPQLYNSRMLGLVTKFQLEVRNQLDSQFYDTIQETKASNEDIENGLLRNAKTAAKVASTIVQLAVVQHLFGKAFESIAGYNPAFDIIEVLMTAFGFDDDDESEDTVLDNIEQGFFALLEDLPYASTFTGGGRIPISSALPIKELVKGEDQYGNEKSRWETLGEIAPYYVLPGGYGQIKKTTQGLGMFSDDHPVAGSYTDSGNLRFPVEDTLGNRVKAGIFGQYASENARKYFDEEQRTLNPEQTEIFAGLDIPIEEYWEYRDNLNEFYDVKDQLEAIANSDDATDEDILRYAYISRVNSSIYDMYDKQKELAGGGNKSELRELQTQMEQMLSNSKYAVDNVSISGAYGEVGDKRFNRNAESGKWYEIKPKNSDGSDNRYYQKEQEVTKGLGVSYEEYWNNREEYNYAYDNPEKYTFSKAVGGYQSFRSYTSELWDIKADKDENGKSINGSRKEKVIDYINDLDADYGEKIILFKSEYNADDTYNEDIIEYLNGRDDISYSEMETILRYLGFEVDSNGNISW